eukprot:s4714_g5.t1
MPSSTRWPEGEEHYAKLAINSLVGLFARNLELVYSMKTSNHQVDGEGCSWRQTFTDAAGGTHWDHVFVTELLSNSSYRPVHDFIIIMGAEYVAVARIRQALAAVPKRYLKCIKTDCLVMQDVSKKYRPAVERLLKMSHRDGTPVYRYEEVTGLKGQYREPTWAKAPLRRVDIITKTHAAVQSVGLGAQTAGHWVRRNVRNGHCSATWLVIEELTQQLPTVLDSFAGAEVCRELKDSQLLHDLAGGWCHELSERWRFDERIFEFLTWLRVDEPKQVPLAEAVQKGTFLTVEAVEGDVVRLESGRCFAGPELLKHTRLCSAITYASVQGLTLRGRVWLYDVESPHFTLKHLYMGCSRATNSELLSVL